MAKRNRIIYWMVTVLLSFGMLSAGIVQLIKLDAEVELEWAYAGFFFTAAGAVISHLAAGDSFGDFFSPLLLLILTVASWYFRPEDRKVVRLAQTLQ